jgi:hypothetical protein
MRAGFSAMRFAFRASAKNAWKIRKHPLTGKKLCDKVRI